jgi:hypothetical protein
VCSPRVLDSKAEAKLLIDEVSLCAESSSWSSSGIVGVALPLEGPPKGCGSRVATTELAAPIAPVIMP